MAVNYAYKYIAQVNLFDNGSDYHAEEPEAISYTSLASFYVLNYLLLVTLLALVFLGVAYVS